MWDCMSTLKPLLDLEDSDMKSSRDDPEIIDSDFLTEGRVGQKKVKLIDQMKAVKDTFVASARAEVILTPIEKISF